MFLQDVKQGDASELIRRVKQQTPKKELKQHC